MDRKFTDYQKRTFEQTENDTLDYIRRAERFLGTDTISTSTWTADNGITLSSESNDTTTATVFVSGGNPGNTYKVTNKIVTAAGRTKDASFTLKITTVEQSVSDY